MASKVNIIIDQGATINLQFKVNDSNGAAQNLSSYSVRSMFRKDYESSNSYSFTCNCFSNGVVTLSMTAAESANVISGRYVYDVELVAGDDSVRRIMEGILTVAPEVTR
jgi:hypothetical protein